MKYKVGQKVKINDNSGTELINGQIYSIIAVDEMDCAMPIRVEGKNDYATWLDADQFELVQEKVEVFEGDLSLGVYELLFDNEHAFGTFSEGLREAWFKDDGYTFEPVKPKNIVTNKEEIIRALTVYRKRDIPFDCTIEVKEEEITTGTIAKF